MTKDPKAALMAVAAAAAPVLALLERGEGAWDGVHRIPIDPSWPVRFSGEWTTVPGDTNIGHLQALRTALQEALQANGTEEGATP